MEDTASYVADVFNVEIIAPGSNAHAGLPVPPGAATAAPPADQNAKADAGAYFGVFDGANNLLQRTLYITFKTEGEDVLRYKA